MEIWQVVVLVVAVAAIGAAVAYGRGREAGESESRHRSAEGDHSLFGEDLPVLPTERRFVEVMPYALIVADSAGAVAYASKGADPLNLVRNGRLGAEGSREGRGRPDGTSARCWRWWWPTARCASAS